MKTLSKLALVALLATGVAGTSVTAPALAQKNKKGKDAAAPGLKLSPEALKAAQVAQPAIAAKDFATAEPALAQLDAAAKTDDDKYIAAALRYDLESQKLYAAQQANPNAPLNETVLAGPLDVLIANPSTPAADKGRYLYRRGVLALNAKQYPAAIQYLTQAQQAGFQNEDLALQIVKARFDSGDTAGGNTALVAEIERMNAAGQKAPEDYYRYAISRANQRKMKAETLDWLKRYVVAYPSAKTWRDVIFTYGLQQNAVATLDKAQRIDLFRLMRAAGALADQYDYEEYAQSVYDRGLPTEAQAVIKEGQAAGKVPATSSNAKTLLTDSATAIRNEGSLASTETKAKVGANGTLAAQTGDAYLGQGNYTKAAELYRLALSKGSVNADEVNTRLGIALARGGDKAGATAAFGAVKGAPRADIAGLWTAWLGTTTPGAAPAAPAA